MYTSLIIAHNDGNRGQKLTLPWTVPSPSRRSWESADAGVITLRLNSLRAGGSVTKSISWPSGPPPRWTRVSAQAAAVPDGDMELVLLGAEDTTESTQM